MAKVKEQTEKELPVSMRENKPRVHAVCINRSRPDGLPDGIHCGAWLDVDTRKVWKSLYGRPWINADWIVRTQEDEFLEKFAGQPYFPRNWEVKPSNGLWWLVRDEAITFNESEYRDLDNETILDVEQAIMKVNSEGWAINDYITLLIDKGSYEYFIGDLSCAHPDKEADDWLHIERFFRICGREHLNVLRSNARTIIHELYFNPEWREKYQNGKEYRHVYASFNRPVSGLWASLGDALYVQEDKLGGEGEMIPFTWIITREPLDKDTIYRYELKWGWSRKR